MDNAKVSLEHLKRLIAKPLEEGTIGDVAGNIDEGNVAKGNEGKVAGVGELNMRETARKLHERSIRRQRQRLGAKEDLGCMSVFSRAGTSFSKDGVEFEPQCDVTQLQEKGIKPEARLCRINGNARRKGGLYTADRNAHLLVNINDGSIRLECKDGFAAVGNRDVLSGCSISKGPSYSFVDAYEKDDRRRLLFIVDQLSHILRVERRQKERLLLHVVPALLRRIEALEECLAREQSERPPPGLRAVCAAAQVGCGDDCYNSGTGSIVEEQLVAILQRCERQINWLVRHITKYE